MQTAAVILAKVDTTSKDDIELLGKKIARLTTICILNKIGIFEVLSVVGSTKDAISRIKELSKSGTFQYLVILSPKDLTNSEAEYLKLVDELLAWHGVQVQVVK